MKDVLVSIDLGTTRLKVAAFAPDGTLHQVRAKRHVDVRDGRQVWQDADAWWRDVVELTRELIDELGAVYVLGLSLSGRGGAAVFTNRHGRVLSHPWSDNRHHRELEFLQRWREGRMLPNYAAALVAKYRWLCANEPRLAAEVAMGFYAKDFLLFRLTGEHRTDWSSGPDGPAWEPALVDELDIPRNLLPEPSLPWALTGGLNHNAATAMGLPAGTPVAVGAHDGICANVGAGAGRPGDYAVTLGTHAVVRAVTSTPPAGSYRFYGLPEHRHVIGGNAVLGGRSADWFLDLLFADDIPREAAFRLLDEAAAGVPPGARGVSFLPFLGGQVSPERRPGARAGFAGIQLDHGRAELYRAVLEGVTFAIRGIFDQVQGWCGPPDTIRLTGSGATSPVWRQILANVLNWPVNVSDHAVEARGAAIFLMVGLGHHASHDAAADAMVPITAVVEPDPDDVAAYAEVYRHWQQVNNVSRAFDVSIGQNNTNR